MKLIPPAKSHCTQYTNSYNLRWLNACLSLNKASTKQKHSIMKVRLRFTMRGLAFFALLLISLLMACNNAANSKSDNTEAQEEATQTPEEAVAPTPEPAAETTAIEAPEAAESPTATTAKTAAPESPAATKTSSPKSAVKTPETVQAPKPAAKPEAPKAQETVTTPTTAKESQPAAPPTTTAPKTAPTIPPAVTETKKVEEAPAKAEPKAEPAPQASSNWPVPASYNNKANPVKATSASIAAGKSLWSLHCKSCHGKNGLGDGPKAAQLDDHPGDFTTKAFQSQTDGALFYKTLEGKGDMPGFKKKIPDEEDLWNLVNFMRTLK